MNSFYEITLDKQLPKGLIPLYVLHNIQHKQPQEMLVPLLNTVSSAVKLPKNTVLGSITKVDNVEYVQNICSPQSNNDKAHDISQPAPEAKPLPPVFLDSSSFQTHAHDNKQVTNTTTRYKYSIRNATQAKYHANQQIYRHRF